MPDCDVLVVGAGAAGLAAARELERNRLHVTCLEARNRIGGRIFSIHDPFSAIAIEMGAEFVHGRSPEIWRIVEDARLTIYDVRFAAVYSENGKIHEDDEDSEDGFDEIFADMRRRAESGDETFLDFLNHSDYSQQAKRSVTGYVEGFNAARKEIIGIASLAEDAQASDQMGGSHSFRIAGGYDAVPLVLAHGLDIRLNSRVERVEWKRGDVSVHTQDQLWRAHAAILTLPLGVLQSGSVRFDPEPADTLRAARSFAVGHAIRVTLRFRHAFWEENPVLENAGFLFSNNCIFPTWWTTLPVRAPLITGWSAGPRADALLGLSESRIIDQAVAALEQITAMTASRVESAYFHDWQADPFSLGAYSYVPAGALPQRAKLAEPVEDTLFFAGEATDLSGHSATVHGAIASGQRAAKKIVHNFETRRVQHK